MARKIVGAGDGGGGTIYPWEPGKSGNPAGRPRKYVSLLKSVGYHPSEITQTIQNLVAMNEQELEDVKHDQNATALEKIIAKSLRLSIKKGGLGPLEMLMTRAYGRPTEAPPIAALPEDYENLTDAEIAAEFADCFDEPATHSDDESSTKKAGAKTPRKKQARKTKT